MDQQPEFVYGNNGAIGLVYDSSPGANMTYDAVSPASVKSTGFTYDSNYVAVQVDGPLGFVYEGACRVQDYDPPLPGINVPCGPSPVADEPTIIDRKPRDAEGSDS